MMRTLMLTTVVVLATLVFTVKAESATGRNPTRSDSQPQQGNVEMQDLNRRIGTVESARQDLSAWATMFVGVVTLLVLVNVSLSVWQVGSLARKEVDEVIAQYNKQFSGFLKGGKDAIAKKLAEYETRVSDLSQRLEHIPSSVQQYAVVASTARADMQHEITQGILRLQNEGERLRADLRRIQTSAKEKLDTEA